MNNVTIELMNGLRLSGQLEAFSPYTKHLTLRTKVGELQIASEEIANIGFHEARANRPRECVDHTIRFHDGVIAQLAGPPCDLWGPLGVYFYPSGEEYAELFVFHRAIEESEQNDDFSIWIEEHPLELTTLSEGEMVEIFAKNQYLRQRISSGSPAYA